CNVSRRPERIVLPVKLRIRCVEKCETPRAAACSRTQKFAVACDHTKGRKRDSSRWTIPVRVHTIPAEHVAASRREALEQTFCGVARPELSQRELLPNWMTLARHL